MPSGPHCADQLFGIAEFPTYCQPVKKVMHLYGVDDAGEILGACDGGDDDFDSELNRMIMRMKPKMCPSAIKRSAYRCSSLEVP